MGIPPAVIALLAEINEWQTKYGETVQNPYDSESFAGYSYSKSKDSKTGKAVTWDVAFRSQLSRWRKI
jgi:hypothetical protein